MNEIETIIGRLDENEIEKNCIRIASNLLEGIIVDKTTNNQRTLGRAIDGCIELFPHRAVLESVKKFYNFVNDYPNLRHAGTEVNRIRALTKDDAVLSIWFALMFSCYLANNDSFKQICLGEL